MVTDGKIELFYPNKIYITAIAPYTFFTDEKPSFNVSANFIKDIMVSEIPKKIPEPEPEILLPEPKSINEEEKFELEPI